MDKKIKEYIDHNVNFLEKYGFTSTLVEKKLTSELSTECIRLKNEYIRIDISFSTFVDSKSINLTIGLLNKNSSFSFEEYVLLKKQNKKICIGSLSEKNEEYIKRFFSLFQKAITDDLGDVLKGKKWIEVPKDYSIIK